MPRRESKQTQGRFWRFGEPRRRATSNPRSSGRLLRNRLNWLRPARSADNMQVRILAHRGPRPTSGLPEGASSAGRPRGPRRRECPCKSRSRRQPFREEYRRPRSPADHLRHVPGWRKRASSFRLAKARKRRRCGTHRICALDHLSGRFVRVELSPCTNCKFKGGFASKPARPPFRLQKT